jgi:hypothetical protein
MNKWSAFAILAGVCLFSAGLLIGRQMPKHHYERLGNTAFLFDTSTGEVCSLSPFASIDRDLGIPETTPSGAPSVWGNIFDKNNKIPPCAPAK